MTQNPGFPRAKDSHSAIRSGKDNLPGPSDPGEESATTLGDVGQGQESIWPWRARGPRIELSVMT